MALPGRKRLDIERHIVDQIGVVVSQAFFVSCKNELVKVAAELIDEPLMFALDAAGRADRCSEKNDMPLPAQFCIESFKPVIGYQVRPQLSGPHVWMGKKIHTGFADESFWK